MDRKNIDSVLRSLRRVNLQGSLFGQTVAIRFGLTESDIEALEVLLDTGSATAGRLSELMGLTTGAVTRVIDRLEQAGYVRRVPDPADRRRVIVELVTEQTAAVESTLDRVNIKSAAEIGQYSDAEPHYSAAFTIYFGLVGELDARYKEVQRDWSIQLTLLALRMRRQQAATN